MASMESPNEKLSLRALEQFQLNHKVKFPLLYKKFLLESNGGYRIPSTFEISEEQGVSVLNIFYGIGDMYSNLADYLEICEDKLPEGFLPIGDDPSGNLICIGTREPYYEKIYFWDHEQEPKEFDNMSNMYFLADDIFEFLDSMFEDPEK